MISGVGTMRNRPCKCGSNYKYKNCCLKKEEGFSKVKQPDGRWAWERGQNLIGGMTYNLGTLIGVK